MGSGLFLWSGSVARGPEGTTGVTVDRLVGCRCTVDGTGLFGKSEVCDVVAGRSKGVNKAGNDLSVSDIARECVER